jgi:hypothetical protein
MLALASSHESIIEGCAGRQYPGACFVRVAYPFARCRPFDADATKVQRSGAHSRLLETTGANWTCADRAAMTAAPASFASSASRLSQHLSEDRRRMRVGRFHRNVAVGRATSRDVARTRQLAAAQCDRRRVPDADVRAARDRSTAAASSAAGRRVSRTSSRHDAVDFDWLRSRERARLPFCCYC